jgi:hypothetical protein
MSAADIGGSYAGLIDEVEKLADAVTAGRWKEVAEVAEQIRTSGQYLYDAAAAAAFGEEWPVPTAERVLADLALRDPGHLLRHLHPPLAGLAAASGQGPATSTSGQP